MWVYGNYGVEFQMTMDDARSCSHQGDCEQDCREFLQANPKISNYLDSVMDKVVKELSEYGAWDEEELKDTEMAKIRLLWVFAGNAVDGMFGDDEEEETGENEEEL